MVLDLARRFNWIDIFVCVCFLRVISISFKHGFALELFKLTGTVAAVYVGLHYYTLCAAAWGTLPVLRYLPAPWLATASLLLLASASYASVFFIRKVCLHCVKMEAVPTLHKWGSCVLGVVRALLLGGLCLYLLMVPQSAYLQRSLRHSFSGPSLLSVITQTYTGIWEGFMVKFMAKEKYNASVTELLTSIHK